MSNPEDTGPTVAEQTGADPGAEINLADPHKVYSREDLMKTLEARSNQKPPEYVPPPPTERQMEQTRIEMEAGARRVAMHEQQKAFRPPPPKEELAREGSTTPVMRPADGAGTKEQDPKRLKG